MKKVPPIIAVLVLVAAACSSSADDSGGVASLENTTEVPTGEESSATTDEEAILAFGECMRENGVPDFEDPVVNGDGSIEFGGLGDRGRQAGNDDFEPGTVRAAFQACSDLLGGLAFGPGSGDFDITEIEDTLVEFAACMRGEGIPFDDPDLSNFGLGGTNSNGQEPGGGGPFGGNFDFDDPEFQAAFEVCQEAVGFGFGRGPGGGRFGGGGDN